MAFKPAHIGSDVQDFLAEEGLLAAVQASSLKRVMAYLLQKDLADRGQTKQEAAQRMKMSLRQPERILDPNVKTIPLDLLVRAAQGVDRKLTITLA